VARWILALSEERYGLFNDSNFTQKLTLCEGIHVSPETLRRLRRGAGIAAKAEAPPAASSQAPRAKGIRRVDDVVGREPSSLVWP
jgi:hypothetical protein